jgi:hypothetical protein
LKRSAPTPHCFGIAAGSFLAQEKAFHRIPAGSFLDPAGMIL